MILLKFLLLLIIWSLITTLFYKLGKLSLSNISERKLIEIIGSQIFTREYLPQYKILKSYQYLFFIICFISFFGGSCVIIPHLKNLQRFIFNTNSGHFISHDVYLFFIVLFGLSCGLLLLIVIFFLRKAPEVPLTQWDNFPSLSTILYKIQTLKNIGFGISMALQICFLFGMMDYIIIEKEVIIRNPISSFVPQTIPISTIKSAKLTFRYRKEGRNSTNEKVFTPLFWIKLENESFNIWTQSLNLSDSIIEKTALSLNKKFIPITIDYPDVTIPARWRINLSSNQFKQIIRTYDYVGLLSNKSTEPTAIGEKIAVQNLNIQIDSAVYSNRANIFSYSDEKPLLIYFTVTNEATDSSFFGTLLDLKIIDKEGRIYTQNIMIEEIGNSHIPPKQTIKIMRGFIVPENRTNLKLLYVLSSFKKQYVEFDL